MRSLLLALLFAAATPVAAQPGFFSIDFSHSSELVAQGETGTASLYVIGTWPTTVPVTWKYTIAGYPEVSGTVYVEAGMKETGFPIVGPVTSVYVGGLAGTASITYQAGSEVTKSIPLGVYDQSLSIALSDARVTESDDLQTLTFTTSKPASMPLTVTFFGLGDDANDDAKWLLDYTLDSEVVLPAGATSGEMHFRALPDEIAEGDEAFTIQGQLMNGNLMIALSRARVVIAEPAVDFAVTLGALKTLTLAPGQTIVVPLQASPLPTQPITLLVFAGGGIVDVAPSLTIGTDGKGALAVTAKKLGSTTIEIDSGRRERLAGLDVIVAPPRARSVRH
jgi:hypothetical protein